MVKKECEDLNIPFHVLNTSPNDLAKLVIDNGIGGIVCDFYPLKYSKQLINSFLEHIPKKVCVIQVSV